MKKTKVVIFDFDNTLYNNVVYENWFNYCKIALKKLIKVIPKNVLTRLDNEENFGDTQVIETISKHGLHAKDWINYRRSHLRTFDVTNATCVNDKVLKEFANKYSLYIVTHNQRFDVERVAKAIGVDLSLFKDILTNTFEDGLFSKKYLYNKIIEIEQVKPEQVFVIGDDFEHDIAPALEIGAKAKQIFNCNFILEDFGL